MNKIVSGSKVHIFKDFLETRVDSLDLSSATTCNLKQDFDQVVSQINEGSTGCVIVSDDQDMSCGIVTEKDVLLHSRKIDFETEV